ncbi:MAG: hypothetical protein WC618_05690 [Patescibacteria group bacterium]
MVKKTVKAIKSSESDERLQSACIAKYKTAVLKYRALIGDDYYRRQGDDLDLKTPGIIIIALFRNCLKDSNRTIKTELLYITLRELTRPFPARHNGDDDGRLIDSIRDHGIELVEKLERL